MKTLYILLSIGLFITLSGNKSMAQEKPGQKEELKYYRQVLKGDSVKAGKVQQIMADYKEAMKTVESDTKFDIELKREKIKALMDNKNKQLKAMLNEQDLELLIPGTERSKTKNH